MKTDTRLALKVRLSGNSEIVYYLHKNKFNYLTIGLVHQHGRHFSVLVHQWSPWRPFKSIYRIVLYCLGWLRTGIEWAYSKMAANK